MTRLRIIERTLWGLGLLLVGFYAAMWAHGEVGLQADLRNFDAALLAARGAASGSAPAGASAEHPVDFELWSAGRVEAYHKSLSEEFDLPLALLRIPKIDLVVPLHDGTDELTLNRAVGRIQGTARPGEPGNLGIAGHRDGFFRGLKEITVGDTIEIVTLERTQTFVVDDLMVTTPDAVAILQDTAESRVTLVTCFPFYFVGSAPRRYIVGASLVEARSQNASIAVSGEIQ